MSLDILLLQSSVVFALAGVGVSVRDERSSLPTTSVAGFRAALGMHLTSACVIALLTGDRRTAGLGVAAGLVTSFALLQLLPSFTVFVRLLMAAQLQLMLVGTAWGLSYTLSLPVSGVTHVLLLAGLPLMVLTLPMGLMRMVPQWDALGRQVWRRPRTARPLSAHGSRPKVSLHVPICAEPPDLVLATLSALARIEYPNFEVLVIDNNTPDEQLWRPVERWCRQDARFRFFHLDRCPGAKAGALNFALRHTAPDAMIIGLIDSDYQARPTFLSALLGYFDDPQVGFVQTPHDYRAWEQSLYQRMCYWEYRVFFATSMASWNEHGAAITVGTMALIRRQALEDAGGWSEWCLTEDSELAPRIHARGYSSVYVGETFGRGLIPETFAGYAKQRRRWTYGPIQELKRHLPMLVPSRFGVRTALTRTQKIFHAHHDLDPLLSGVALLVLPWGLALLASLVIHGERPAVPMLVWIAGVVTALTSQVIDWAALRRAMRCSLMDLVCARMARSALTHSIATSALRALFGVPLSWQRTDKFKAPTQGIRRALASARVELTLGVTHLLVGLGGLWSRAGGLRLFLFLGVALQGVGYLMAPTVAVLAEWELWRAAAQQLQDIAADVQAVA